jgi:DNA topoisomerase-1
MITQARKAKRLKPYSRIFMSKTLFIVESPAKAKKLSTLLGSQYTVKASVGHIRDLPVKSLGVDLESLQPTYEVTDDKKQVVSGLRRFLKDHTRIILATDPDREGEAIAWHLKAALNLKEGTYERVVYQEVTKAGIAKALSNPRDIDMKIVAAQESRRVLDRLIGYLVSPALAQKAGVRLSAGRVQSVAVRMVVERERAIENFQPLPYKAIFLTIPEAPELKAELRAKPWAEDEKHVTDPLIVALLTGPRKVRLVASENKQTVVKQREPLTTVSMQGLSGKLFGLSAKDTMKAAQALFEQGHITYHRTDNPNVSDEGFQKAVAQVQAEGMVPSLDKPAFKTSVDAQEAHEAIRPTDFSATEVGDSVAQKQVYSIIRERALLLALPAGMDSVANMLFKTHEAFTNIEGAKMQAEYLAKGRIVLDPGWRMAAKIERFTTKDTHLPNLDKGADFNGTVKAEKKETQPPARFNEHTLTKALEAAGIGRPSTYAAILENIKTRNYVEFEATKSAGKTKTSPPLKPTDRGFYIVDALINLAFMNYGYTREVERSLDKIAHGKMSYKGLVGPVLKQIQEDVETKIQGESLAKVSQCPVCTHPVVQHTNKKGAYWMHRDKAHSEQCELFIPDQSGYPAKPAPKITSQCPNCNKPIKQLTKNRNAFWVHEDKADQKPCGVTFIDDNAGKPVMPIPPKTSLCVECGDTIKRCYSSKNDKHFWVHSKKKPKCGNYFIDDREGEPAFKAES